MVSFEKPGPTISAPCACGESSICTLDPARTRTRRQVSSHALAEAAFYPRGQILAVHGERTAGFGADRSFLVTL